MFKSSYKFADHDIRSLQVSSLFSSKVCHDSDLLVIFNQPTSPKRLLSIARGDLRPLSLFSIISFSETFASSG